METAGEDTTKKPEPSGVLRRAVAFGADLAIAAAVGSVVTALLGLFVPLDELRGYYAIGVSALATVVFFIAAPFVFGNSLGKFAMGIKAISAETGGPPTWLQVFLRGLLIGLWPLEGLVALFSENNRRIGDRLAGTLVVLDREDERSWLFRLAACAFSLGAAFFIALGAMAVASKRTGIYRAAQAGVAADIAKGLADERFGAPVRLGRLPYRVEVKDNLGLVVIPINGSRKAGWIEVKLERDASGWSVQGMKAEEDIGALNRSYSFEYHGLPAAAKRAAERAGGAEVNSADENGRTALMGAVGRGQEQIAALLLKQGAAVDKKDKDGRTALDFAAAVGNEAIIAALLQAGADLNCVANDLWTPLMTAAGNGRLDAVRLLVLSGADRDRKSVQGATALDIARKNGREDVARFLESIRPNPGGGGTFAGRYGYLIQYPGTFDTIDRIEGTAESVQFTPKACTRGMPEKECIAAGMFLLSVDPKTSLLPPRYSSLEAYAREAWERSQKKGEGPDKLVRFDLNGLSGWSYTRRHPLDVQGYDTTAYVDGREVCYQFWFNHENKAAVTIVNSLREVPPSKPTYEPRPASGPAAPAAGTADLKAACEQMRKEECLAGIKKLCSTTGREDDCKRFKKWHLDFIMRNGLLGR